MDRILIQQYLNTLYFQSRNDPRSGCPEKMLAAILGWDAATAGNTLRYLEHEQLVRRHDSIPGRIVLTPPGSAEATEYRKGKLFRILQFRSRELIPPDATGRRGLLFRYDFSDGDGKQESHTIAVFADGLLCMRWSLQFDKQGLKDTEKILARMAAKEMAEKGIADRMQMAGPGSPPEKVLLSFHQQPDTCPYDPAWLPGLDQTIYEIGIHLPENYTFGFAPAQGKDGRAEPKGRRKVFISYSHDNDPQLLEWVANLAARIAAYNIHVLLDQENMKGGDNKYQFMDPAIREADKVLIILTPSYKVKAETRQGGVGYEYALITEDLYRNMMTNRKYIPLLRSGSTEFSIPVFIRQFITVDMRAPERFEQGLEELMEAILDRPAGSTKPRAGDFRNPEPAPGRPPEQKDTRDTPGTPYREFIEKLGLASTLLSFLGPPAHGESPHEHQHPGHDPDPPHNHDPDPNPDPPHDHDPDPPHDHNPDPPHDLFF